MPEYKKIYLRNNNKILRDIFSSKIKFIPRKIDRPVILYGAGNLGKMAKNFLDYMHIPILYVVDKNAKEHQKDKFWESIKIVHPDEASEKDKKNCLLIICLVTSPLLDLYNELKNKGWKDVVLFYDTTEAYTKKYPINNGWFLKILSSKEKKLIKKVYILLTGPISRAHYLRFLAWRRMRAELIFEDKTTTNENRFFIPEILRVLNNNEIFVDCGAHKGSVTEKFLKITKNKFRGIYTIEPDSKSFKILKERLEKVPKIKFFKCALSDKKGKEKFYEGFDFASKINPKGKKEVSTVKLDDLKIKPTFIKMHLEGGEFKALKGALQTLKKERPIVAITFYHNSDGAWKTPLFVIDSLKNYKYYLRLHSWAGTGAVLYAIPKERKSNNNKHEK